MKAISVSAPEAIVQSQLHGVKSSISLYSMLKQLNTGTLLTIRIFLFHESASTLQEHTLLLRMTPDFETGLD